jgi:serine/threonine protein kinase
MTSQYPGQGPGAPGHAPDPLLGQTIGNYLVRQKLGEGGMGSVYLAEHPHIGKKVALKVLHAEFASNQDVVSRFFNEAKAVNDIGHPNIVDIVDYGVIQGGPLTGEGMVYFIMEFLGGTTLTDLERRESPLAPERALSIALSVADALSASHKCGIVHRDLKPDNIMLVTRGRERDFVKLLDFGIAKLTGDQPGSRRTRTGIVMGTPAYMSPEQCEGRGNVDHRTDIYALGIVIYEMITGRVPFVGDGYGEILVQHLTQMPVPPSTIRGVIPPHVEAIVMKALNKRPEDRYPTMDEFMKAIADPVGYVEMHGGLAGFQQTVLVPTSTPLSTPYGVRLTPSPLSPLTPVPGSMTGVTGVGPAPTTLGAGSGQVAGGGKKVGLIAGLGLLAVGGAVVALLVSSGGQNPTAPAGGTEVAAGIGSAADPGVPKDPAEPVVAAAPIDAAPPPPDAAAAPAVEPPPVEPASATVAISIESTPPGALVFFNKERKARGKTPLTFEVPRADKEVEIDLELSGHHSWEKKISIAGNQELDAVLQKRGSKPGPAKPGPAKPGPAKPGPSAGDNTLNPFD